MPPGSESESKIDLRVVAAVFLLGAAAALTWLTIDGLSARHQTRIELAEISHVRHGLLTVDVWLEKLLPILAKKIDAWELTPSDKARLRPTVESALYELLDKVKEKMSAPPPADAGLGGFLSQANPMLVNMIVGTLKPHVPEYTDVVMAELTKSRNKQAFKQYSKIALADAARNTFGNVDTRWYSSILKQHGCADAASCREQLAGTIREADARIARYYLGALAACAIGLVLLFTRRPRLSRAYAILGLLFCIALLLGGVLTPMIEVEAKLTQVSLTLMGEKLTFPDQVLYFQSKSVLEVFDALIRRGRADMWVVGVLVLMFSVVFPAMKILVSTWYLFQADLLERSRIARFFVLESSKWSMADVMALAIFMAFVAFNGLVTNTMGFLAGMGIPTDSSKILPGYYLFIGFCLASLFLAKKLAQGVEPARPGLRERPHSEPQA